jgi:D-alanine transaminase
MQDGIRGVVWFNGALTDFSSAKASVEDRGFLFGDGVYEVIRVYDGTPFSLAEHLARLQSSAAGIELALPVSPENIAVIAEDVLKRSGIDNAEIYIQVTRGAARRNHLFPKNATPSLFVGARPVREIPAELRETGCSVVTHPDERWARCNLKTICLLPNVLAKEHASRQGSFEALLIRDGLMTEGSSSNVFLLIEETLVTPIADNRILPGITRGIVIDLARRQGRSVVERDIPLQELSEAQEIFLTSTTMELMPVVKADGKLVGDGRPGPTHGGLSGAFRSLTRMRSSEDRA